MVISEVIVEFRLRISLCNLVRAGPTLASAGSTTASQCNRSANDSEYLFPYEGGGQPPFSTPDTSAVKLGYRIQWDGWFGRPR